MRRQTLVLVLALMTAPTLAQAQDSRPALPAAASSDALLRQEFFEHARPAITNLLLDTERRIGLPMVFVPLPTNDPVVARCIFDPFRNEPRIQLRAGWQDVDMAHELMHMRMDLLEGFNVLAWRRDVSHTTAVEEAFGRVQTYVNDEVVHARLAQAGLRIDGEIIRPPLFDSIYTDAARYLEEGRDRANDGMAHLDKLGHGALCRSAFLVQAELLLKNWRKELPPRRIEQTERFIRAFRAHRAEESAAADAVLKLFQQHDVQTPAGQRAILTAWATMEHVDRYVGPSSYQKTEDGRYFLPFPE